MTQPEPLTEAEIDMLEFEAGGPTDPAVKIAGIRDRFNLPLTVYCQRLNALVDRRAAWDAYPTVMHQVERQRRRRWRK